MSGKIFVPLGKLDRIEDILPFLRLLARPATEVVFLAPYREKISWMEVQLTTMQSGTRAITAITALTANAARQAHLHSIVERIRPAREALHNDGMTVVARCYSGSLRSAIASLRDADDEIVVLLSGHTILSKFRARARQFLSPFGINDTMPMLFLRPRRQC